MIPLFEIGDFSFAGTAITEFEVPSSVEKISNTAFFLCNKLEKLRIPSSLDASKMVLNNTEVITY